MRERLSLGIAGAITTGLLLAPTPASENPGIPLANPHAETCADDFSGSSLITPGDLAELPVIDPNKYAPLDPTGAKKVGAISVKNGVAMVDAPSLPTAYQEALQ